MKEHYKSNIAKDDIYVFGKNTVLECLTSNKTTQIYFQQSKMKDKKLQEILDKANSNKINNSVVNDKLFTDYLYRFFNSGDANHQGVIAKIKLQTGNMFSSVKQFFNSQKPKEPYTFMILDSITDTHNFGAIIRSCDIFGVTAIIYPQNNSAPINFTSYKTSSGAINYATFIEVVNLTAALKELQEYNVWNYAMTLKNAKPIQTMNLKGNVGIVMGSEESGIRRLVLETCDERIYIPQTGHIDSLNVSVASGVVLYEIQRQRIIAGII